MCEGIYSSENMMPGTLKSWNIISQSTTLPQILFYKCTTQCTNIIHIRFVP